MDKKTITNAGEQARTEVNHDNGAENLAVQTAERTRALAISNIGEAAGVPQALIAEHIGKGTTAEQFSAVALAERAKRTEENPTRAHHATITRDERETLRLGLPQAIMHVQGLSKVDDKDPGYQFRDLASRGLMAIAENCAAGLGHNTRTMSRDNIVRLALTSTSDLPYILGATADSALRAGYAAVPSQWPKISARRTVANFRPQYDLTTSLAATFPKVPESGEYKVATISEGRETYRIYTYGNKLLVTRQVIINDSLGALTDIPQRMGAAAAYAQATLFWAHVVANGTLSDGTALFATGHSNYITPGTAISVDNLGIARKTLAVQTNAAGEVIGLTPAYMVVPAAKEQLARQYLSNAYNPAQSSNINPWAGMAELLVEPRLDASSATAWYLFANPTLAPVFVHCYLAGNEGVFSQSETTVDIDGFKWLARFDFGVGSVDHRGAVMNAGA